MTDVDWFDPAGDARLWAAEFAKVKVAGPLPMRFRVSSWDVTVEMESRDRDTGEPRRIFMAVPLPYRYESWLVPKFLWEVVRRAYLHEAAEFFTVSGVRVMDPHVHGEPK